MAKKLMEVHIEKISPEMWKCYTDLTEAELRTIAGVDYVTRVGDCLHQYHLYLDPRYDQDEIIREIEQLAHQKAIQEE